MKAQLPQPEPHYWAPRYWPTQLGLALLRLLTLLPYSWHIWLGTRLGRLAHALIPKRRRIADINLRLCFPEWDEQKRAAVLKAHFESVGIALLEMGLCWWAPDRKLKPLVQVEGLQYLDQALAQGKGALLLGQHATTLEIGLRLLAVNIEPRIHPLYQIHADPFMERVITANRERHSGEAISSDNIRGLLKALKQNKVVWYAPDQGYSGKNSALVPFFGIAAATHTATSRLAALSGAPVIPFLVLRLPGSTGYKVTLRAPLEDFPSDDPVADTLRYHHLIEEQARLAPEQYLWIHRRFKGRGPEYPDVYASDKT